MRRLAVYAHWDPQHRIKRYVLHTLEQLRKTCDRIVFVSTAKPSSSELEKVRPLVGAILERENVGYDFAMWRDALFANEFASWDEIVLTNSSVIGPIAPLEPIFERMTGSGCDFWGMTESAMYAVHLQSYFLVFRQRLLQAPVFERFWKSILPYKEKLQVVRSYELGLTRFFADEGFHYAALIRHADLAHRLRTGKLPRTPFGRVYRLNRRLDYWLWKKHLQNPTYLYPLELLELGLPFVKYELFRDNARRFPLERVFRVLEAAGYPRELILDG